MADEGDEPQVQEESPPEAPPEPEPQEKTDEPEAPAEETQEEPPTEAPEPESQEPDTVEPQVEAPAEEAQAEEPQQAPSEPKQSISSQEGRTSKKSIESAPAKGEQEYGGSIGNLIPQTSKTSQEEKTDKLSSRAKLVLGSVIDIKGQITAEASGITRTAKFANNYRLDSLKPFNHEQVLNVLTTVLPEAIEGITYNPAKCAAQAKWATKAVRAKVKEMEFDRYKIVCACTIGEKNSQHFLCSMRFLWDLERDNYAVYILENPNVFVIGYCFGTYYE